MGLNPQTKQNHTTPESQKSFHDFHLPKTIQSSLEQMGFKTPTPIQADAIPVALTGNDVIGLAQTGTGKTAAFAIPTLVRLLKDPKATALVLVPTRELAAQVCEVFVALTRNNPELKTVSLIGGASMQTQERRLKSKCRILVATPGRLIDHLEKSRGLLDPTAIVILDEADRMLDMGFAPQLKQINRHLPEGRQTMLFSATFSKEIEALSMRTLKSPVKIQCVASLKPPARIEQKVLFLNGEAKNETLLDEINAREGSILIFVRTKRRTDRVAKYLASYGLKVSCIHGNKSQGQRNLAIKLFREEESRILCATDLVA
ncbi:MAG: DEAD/DEAH box helicase, partial [Proteobacteria bacterium]|nr:DEAD/DEAH box helicase [Pseudomonadota bacterium]